jgi:HAD superfamily hydrolase (TIGR01459 family)
MADRRDGTELCAVSQARTAASRIIPGLSAIADSFDHVLLDQWGVLHDGRALIAGAVEAVRALGKAGKGVLVLSNSGKPAAENAERLARLGLPADAYAGIVTSGEVCRRLLRRRDAPPFDRLGPRCLLVTRGGDRSVVKGLGLSLTEDPAAADFILLAGLDDAMAEVEAWRPRWAAAIARGLPMICANPDLTMITPAGLVAGAGRMAALYAELGGAVTYVGKPHAPIYEECLAILGGPAPGRVLAIGDSLDHDVKGGRAMGMATALVTSGILAPEFGQAHGESEMLRTLDRLVAVTGERPQWVLMKLCW